MVEEKGLAVEVADRIGHYVKLHGGMELLDQLASEQNLVDVKEAKVGLDEMRILLRFCELFGVLDKVRQLTLNADYIYPLWCVLGIL